ncbi:MAG TPA: ABC transporter permease, partial [Bryobacteraceae bacterium]|nr:ABC transporter permease [Bryobacteraceae bacterium]
QAQRTSVSAGNLGDYENRARSLSGLSGIKNAPMNLTGNGTPERLQGQGVSLNFFRLLGISPSLGRGFAPDEGRPGSNFVVVLSNELWRRRFGADSQILGQSLMLDGNRYRVVGVLPPGFQSPSEFSIPQHIEFYVPAVFSPQQLAEHGDHDLSVIGRLTPGTSVERAQHELDAISAALARQFPHTNSGVRAVIAPLRDDLTRSVRLPLLMLLGAVALAVLIACANVANLFLVRAISRRREISIRFALGASRLGVMREFLTESSLLAAAGGGAGLFLGYFLMKALVAMAPANTPGIASVSLDSGVFAVSMALAGITGIAFGLAPAWQCSRISAGESIKANDRSLTGPSQHRSRAVLIIAEISMATVLLVGAGLLLKSFITVLGIDLGFKPERVLGMNVRLPATHYPTPADRLRFYEDLEERVRILPGVQSVAFANHMPLRGGWSGGIQIEGSERVARETGRQAVSPGYFDTLGITLVRGRLLTPGDRTGHPDVALVNQAFARLFFPGLDPIGHRIRIGSDFPWMTISGVVNDIRREGKTAPLNPQVYMPAGQLELYPNAQLADLAIRTAGDPKQLVRAIREQVFAIDKDQPVNGIHTMDEIITASVAQRRFRTILLMAFAAVALSLALVGIFGVLSHSVSQRTVELGIRAALGAQRRAILTLVLRQAAVWVATSLLIGIATALALSRCVASLLFEVQPHDWRTYAIAAALLAFVSLAAAAIPAHRASKVDPMIALRYE